MATQTKLIASESFSAQVRREGLPSTECPCREMLKDVTSPWGILLLIVLMGEVRRFSELRRMVGGVSEKNVVANAEAPGSTRAGSSEVV